MAKAGGRAWRGFQPPERVKARGHAGYSRFQKNVCKAVGSGQKAYQFQSFSSRSMASSSVGGRIVGHLFHLAAGVFPAFAALAIDRTRRVIGQRMEMHRGPAKVSIFCSARQAFANFRCMGAVGRYVACVTGQSCSFRAARLPPQTVRKHRYASDCYQNAQALVAWHIAPFFRCRFRAPSRLANRPSQLPPVLV